MKYLREVSYSLCSKRFGGFKEYKRQVIHHTLNQVQSLYNIIHALKLSCYNIIHTLKYSLTKCSLSITLFLYSYTQIQFFYNIIQELKYSFDITLFMNSSIAITLFMSSYTHVVSFYNIIQELKYSFDITLFMNSSIAITLFMSSYTQVVYSITLFMNSVYNKIYIKIEKTATDKNNKNKKSRQTNNETASGQKIDIQLHNFLTGELTLL